MSSPSRIAESLTLPEFAGLFDKARQVRAGQWEACCPAPGHGGDRSPSLSISEGEDGKKLLNCHKGCSYDEIMEAIGAALLASGPQSGGAQGNGQAGPETGPPPATRRATEGGPPWEHVATYTYLDESDERVVEWKERYERVAGGRREKKFYSRRPVSGGWTWQAPRNRVLYNLYAVIEAAATEKWVFVVEGEKDADRLISEGLTATTTPKGGNGWKPDYSERLKGARVAVLPDNDKPGQAYAEKVAQDCLEAGVEVRIVELPNLAENGDVSDWLDNGGSVAELWRLVEAATPFQTGGELTELHAARRLRDECKGVLRHSKDMDWLVWDGRRWAKDEKAACREADKLGDLYRADSGETRNETEAQRLRRFAKHCDSMRGMNSILSMAAHQEGIDANHVEFDSHRWLLNVPNGTVDLRTGEMRRHCKEDYLTQLCPTRYVPGAKAERFRRCILEVFGGDKELADYFQWAIGYAITGSKKHHCFFICHGSGSNGKSTIFDALMGMLGEEYAHQCNPEMLLQQKHDRHPTEIAALRAKRLTVASETPQGARLKDSLIKAHTGDERLRARYMRQDEFEFSPQHKLFLQTNHRPQIPDDSQGMWRRIRLIPFEQTFDPGTDPTLAETLRCETAGILAWAVEGAMRVCDGEPGLPLAVQAATEEYRKDEDLIGAFIEEYCEVFEGACCEKRVLYQAYSDVNGGRVEKSRSFNHRIKERGYEETRTNKGRMAWQGIQPLKDAFPEAV